MIKSDEQLQDADIKAAISAVAAYSAARYKRQLINRMVEDLMPEVHAARLAGSEIDTSELFLRLAEKYAN